MNLINSTDYVVDRFVVQDAQGKDRLLVIAKATYDLNHVDGLTPADEQMPLVVGDEYFEDPESSGVKYSSDVAWGLCSTDVALIGAAVAPDEYTSVMEVLLKVGALERRVAVFGERRWKPSLVGARLSRAQTFDRIPLVYDHAFGGQDCSAEDDSLHEYESRNPLGGGLRGRTKSRMEIKDLKVPNLEDPERLIRRLSDRPIPAGFGFIAPYWQPRLKLAGTYDETWQKERMPQLPEDFDVRHNQSAHPSMIYDGFLTGEEEIAVIGVTAGSGYAFRLPGMKLVCAVDLTNSDYMNEQMNLNKLIIDTDEKKVLMTWSTEVDLHGRLYEVGEITVRVQESVELDL